MTGLKRVCYSTMTSFLEGVEGEVGCGDFFPQENSPYTHIPHVYLDLCPPRFSGWRPHPLPLDFFPYLGISSFWEGGDG